MQRILAALTVFAVTSVLCLGATAPASADDGRGRTPQAEIAAQFTHDLDRQPDAAGLEHYMQFVRKDCQWGVVDATYRIATSGDAVSRWGGNPQDLAGMLYASLLNRAPDPGGLAAYTESIKQRGLSLSTADMLGSPEYRSRLTEVCGAATGLNASMYDWRTGMSFAEQLVDKALNLGATCVALKGVQKLTGLKENAEGIRLFIGVTGQITNKIYGKLDGTCAAAVMYVKAAVRIAEIVVADHGNNPVFIQFDMHRSWWTLRTVKYFTVRIGTLPTTWSAYNGKVGDANIAGIGD